MQLDIFKGKKAKYNKLILRALYEKGRLKPWGIAKEVVMNDPGRKVEGKKKYWYQNTQRVYSALIRKGGRLEELERKEFIEKSEERYWLTVNKGLCLALTLYKDIQEPAIDPFSKSYELFPELKEAMEIFFRLYPEAKLRQYEFMLSITKELLDIGLNLDMLSNRDFNRFFSNQWQEFTLRALNEKRGEWEKRNISPEFQKNILKFLKRIKEMILRQVKEFDSLEESLEKSIRKEETGS